MVVLPINEWEFGDATVAFDETDKVNRWIVVPLFDIVSKQLWKRTNNSILFYEGLIIRYRRGPSFDGASIPPLFWFYETPSESLPSAMPHDDGYLYHFIEVWDGTKWVLKKVSKLFVDRLYRRLHIMDRPNEPEHAWINEVMVVAFGWWAWWTRTCNSKCNKCKERQNCSYVKVI